MAHNLFKEPKASCFDIEGNQFWLRQEQWAFFFLRRDTLPKLSSRECVGQEMLAQRVIGRTNLGGRMVTPANGMLQVQIHFPPPKPKPQSVNYPTSSL